jgi:hypothetical protein
VQIAMPQRGLGKRGEAQPKPPQEFKIIIFEIGSAVAMEKGSPYEKGYNHGLKQGYHRCLH